MTESPSDEELDQETMPELDGGGELEGGGEEDSLEQRAEKGSERAND